MEPLNRICNTCKVQKPLEEYFRDKKLKLGREYCCKQCSKKQEQDVHPLSIKHKFRRLKVKAKERGIPVLITEEQYAELIKSRKCYYCDSSTLKEKGGELNRIDSNKPYIVDNLKNCCKICNRLMCNFTKEELQDRLVKIHRRL